MNRAKLSRFFSWAMAFTAVFVPFLIGIILWTYTKKMGMIPIASLVVSVLVSFVIFYTLGEIIAKRLWGPVIILVALVLSPSWKKGENYESDENKGES